jgi:hypothetical protein
MESSEVGHQNEKRTIDLMNEQIEIIQHLNYAYEKYSGRGYQWNHFRGNIVSNMVTFYLEKHLPSNVKLVKQSWVEECPTEFDIMIVDKDAQAVDFTDAYRKEKVKLLIELKSSGVYYRRTEIRKRMSEMFERYKSDTGKPALFNNVGNQSSCRRGSKHPWK